MGVGRIFVDFSAWTSAHGIPHIGSAQNKCLRIFWSIIFIASVGMFCWQMYLLIDKYLSYDVTVSTELKFEERDFPAVTVCNLNPYILSRLNATNSKGPSHSKGINDLMADYNLYVKSNTVSAGDPWGFASLNDTIAVQAKAREWLLYLAAALTETQKQQIIYKPNDFIISCAYNTQPCNSDTTTSGASDFKLRIDPIYGACYTFNFAYNPKVKFQSTRAGPLYGLRLLLKSDQSDYLPLTESAGVRVAIHGQREEPFPDAFGYNAAAGFTTSFGVKFIKTSRLGEPYGNCTDDKSQFAYYYDDDYTVEGCFRSCFQNNIIKTCTCGDPRFRKGGDSPGYCLNSGCVSQFSSSSSSSGSGSSFNAITQCGCPQPCSESTFGVTVSTAIWPAEVYIPPECRNASVVKYGAADPVGACTKWYADNTMMVEIYYERMNYQELSESAAYGLVNLISDTGGQLGLWMGISVITMIEFLILPVLLCAYCANKRNVPEAAKPQEMQQFDKLPPTSPSPPPPYPANEAGQAPNQPHNPQEIYNGNQNFASDYAPPPVVN